MDSKKLLLLGVVVIVAIAAVMIVSWGTQGNESDKLPKYTVTGETDLDGNFFISFVYSQNIIMMDGKGNVVWSHHEDDPADGTKAGFWDFKKHVIDGKVYYSYHDQNGKDDQTETWDRMGLEGYAPGERVILDSNFKEVKRVRFEESTTVEKDHPLDGHDFLMIDLNHYIMSGYIKGTVYNIPGYESGSEVIYSYLQEVQDGEVVWDWRSIDYPEIYDLVQTDANPDARDFANVKGAPDYIHFNAMRLNDDGDLVCSFRHLDTILGLDRTKDMASNDQIKWRISGVHDEFGLTEDEKTSGQHYVTVEGDIIRAFDNHNVTGKTRVVSYEIDLDNRELKEFKQYRIDGKFSSACGSAVHIKDDIFALGWGRSENDSVNMCVYDFATDTELIRMTLENANNFTYRCAYYD